MTTISRSCPPREHDQEGVPVIRIMLENPQFSRNFGIRDQPLDRPALDLVGRPRPLISGSLSRARARATEGKCWG